MTTLGTAGHIDHGKTALVRALTGVDTDRLPAERERGISIELGYARLELPGGRALSVIDVPGHERFVRTMVAGATGVDLYLMTIAADDGVMPQTREHAAVLAALGVEVGVVAVTKADRADPAGATAQAAALLPGAEVVPVSAKTGAGIGELRTALERAADRAAARTAEGGLRLHVDRVFTIRGAGTVVTGTLWSGVAERGAEVTILPGGRRSRVRGVQVHDSSVERAEAGQRVALNLVGVEVREVARGDVVVGAGVDVAPAYRVDAALTWADPALRPDHGDRVQVHHGTREAPARLAELGGRYWQLRLERPLVPAAGDRLVIRQIAPPDTLGGGVVLDPRPARHGPSRDALARLAGIERGEPDPPAAAAPRGSGASAAATPRAEPAPLSPEALAVEERLRAAGAEPPLDSELPAPALKALRDAGRAVRLGPAMHVHPDALARVRDVVLAHLDEHGSITLAQLRDRLGTTRKFAQAWLERLDADKVTLRRGDERVARRR
jgi:selenocysteine-specific elongation factor